MASLLNMAIDAWILAQTPQQDAFNKGGGGAPKYSPWYLNQWYLYEMEQSYTPSVTFDLGTDAESGINLFDFTLSVTYWSASGYCIESGRVSLWDALSNSDFYWQARSRGLTDLNFYEFMIKHYSWDRTVTFLPNEWDPPTGDCTVPGYVWEDYGGCPPPPPSGTSGNSVTGNGGSRVTLQWGEYEYSVNIISGTAGDDKLWGESEADILEGGAGKDALFGGAGGDQLFGDAGDDVLIGMNDDDWLYGGIGNDSLYGGSEDDTLMGGAGADLLDGGEDPQGEDEVYRDDDFDVASYVDSSEGLVINIGNSWASSGIAKDDVYLNIEAFAGSSHADTILGTATEDKIFGGSGDDRIWGYEGYDVLDGQDGDDVLDGGTERDVLSGGYGNDTLWGGEGNDSLYGDAGADVLHGGAGADWLDGGEGVDVVFYDEATEGLNLNLGNSWASSGIAKDDIYVSIEGYVGSRYNDEIRATTARDLIWAHDGDDLVWGFEGNDVLDGQGGHDSLDGGIGDDEVYGGVGNDILWGGAGADRLDGGEGQDTVSYDDSTEGLNLNIGNSWASSGIAKDDIYVSIEAFVGSRYNDEIRATAVRDQIQANSGDDVVWGFEGDDVLDGQGGSDKLDGGAGADRVFGGEGNDMLWGGEGYDALWGGAGADRLDGGEGQDTVSYDDATEGLNLNIGNSWASSGIAKDDIYVSIEAYVGSRYNDEIRATTANDQIYAGFGDDLVWGFEGDDLLRGDGGNDWIDGGVGNDTLWGGGGNDVLTGGSGRDAFLFRERPYTTHDGDRVTDFNVAEDVIQLDASAFRGARTGFSLAVGSAADAAGPQVVYNAATGELSYDWDGTGSAAQIKFATLSAGLALSASNFIGV